MRSSGYRYFASVLGLLLLSTAALKTHAAFTAVSFDAEFLSSRWVVLAIAEFEFSLGAWLLTGVYPRFARRCALLTFLCFLAVSLLTVFNGERSCSCFGALNVSPWVAASIDFSALIALFLCRPEEDTPTRTISPCWRPLFGMFAFALLALPIALAWNGDANSPLLMPSKHVVDLGILSPGEWRDSSLSLSNDRVMPVEIETITSSCPCLSLKCVPRVVSPSGTAEMIVTLDLGKEPSFVGNLRIHVQGKTRSGTLAVSLQVIAKVRQPRSLPQPLGTAFVP